MLPQSRPVWVLQDALLSRDSPSSAAAGGSPSSAGGSCPLPSLPPCGGKPTGQLTWAHAPPNAGALLCRHLLVHLVSLVQGRKPGLEHRTAFSCMGTGGLPAQTPSRMAGGAALQGLSILAQHPGSAHIPPCQHLLCPASMVQLCSSQALRFVVALTQHICSGEVMEPSITAWLLSHPRAEMFHPAWTGLGRRVQRGVRHWASTGQGLRLPAGHCLLQAVGLQSLSPHRASGSGHAEPPSFYI